MSCVLLDLDLIMLLLLVILVMVVLVLVMMLLMLVTDINSFKCDKEGDFGACFECMV